MSEHEEAVDADEMARILHVSRESVYVRARAGEIPAFKVGRVWRFWPSQVRAHLEQEAAARDPWAQNSHMRGAHLAWERRRARER